MGTQRDFSWWEYAFCMTTLQKTVCHYLIKMKINTQLTNKIKYVYPRRIHVLYTRIYTQNMHLGSNPNFILNSRVDK